LGVRDLETAVSEASKNILKMLSRGDKARVLRKEDDVLLIGDQRDLSPIYTETLAKIIREWQKQKTTKVHVRYLPKQRPITDIRQVDPSIAALAAKADIVIVTYSNPGEAIRNQESPILNKVFLDAVRARMQSSTIRLYAVAGRPNLRVLEILADTEAIDETNKLSKQLKRYLQHKSGEKMQVYTLKEGRYGDPLEFTIPGPEMVSADYFEVNENIINIPSGEVFFEPTPGTGKGKLYFKEGSYYNLSIPVKGMVILEFKDGEISDCRNLGGKDEEVHKFMEKHFEAKDNRYLAEMGIGTYIAASKIPMEDLIYNRTILEKLQGFHVAYGSSIHIKGKHEAPEHVDNWVKYGDVYIGEDHLISKGKVNTKLLGD
jgi:leucyl aminopeptidase (aminopeptidase T)